MYIYIYNIVPSSSSKNSRLYSSFTNASQKTLTRLEIKFHTEFIPAEMIQAC